MHKSIIAFTFTLLLVAIIGCTQAPATVIQIPTLAVLPSMTPAPSEIPTEVPTSTVENTPMPTVTPILTVSPLPTETPLPSPTSIPTETLQPTLSVAAQGWQISQETSLIDDTETVTITRLADMPVRTWLSTATPMLVLRCKARTFEIYINADAQFDSDTEYNDRAYVKLRWDKEVATTVSMSESTSGEAVFFADPQATLRTMTQHSELVFGFQPFNAGETATTFQLGGLGEVIQPLLDACGLPPLSLPASSVISGQEARVIAQMVSLRSCPQKSCSTAGVLIQDDLVVVLDTVQGETLGENSTWYLVSFRNQDGYVHSSMLISR